MLKSDGTPVQSSFFADNAAAIAEAAGGGEGGDGAVASVNGQTGVVVLSAANVGAPTVQNLTDGLALKASKLITFTAANSLEGGGDLTGNRTLQLVGDTNAPGNNKVYGTNGGGARGWLDMPVSGVPQNVFFGGGSLTGYSDEGTSATPATATLLTSGTAVEGDTLSVQIDGTVLVFEFDPNSSGVADGHIAITADDVGHIVAVMQGAGLNIVDIDAGSMLLTSAATGAGARIILSASNGFDITFSTTDGTDAIPPSGEVTGLTLIAGVTGKRLVPVSVTIQTDPSQPWPDSGTVFELRRGSDVLMSFTPTGAPLVLDMLAYFNLANGLVLPTWIGDASTNGEDLFFSATGGIPTGCQMSIMITAIAV